MGKERDWRETRVLIRLHFIVEGQTEETFVRDLLTGELGHFGVVADVRRIQTGRRRGVKFRGGSVGYEQTKGDIKRWILEDRGPDVRFTSMVDLYRLPNDFPKYDECQHVRSPAARAEKLEAALGEDIGDSRFIPYLQVHEFEALLFSQPSSFAVAFPERPKPVATLGTIRAQFASPEEINNGEQTSPAKRICDLFPDYDKVTAGLEIAKETGLIKMEQECPHFAQWMQRLRQLDQPDRVPTGS